MALLWATSYPLGRYLAEYDAPQAIVAVRALIAFTFLWVIARRRAEAPPAWEPRLLGHFLLLGITGFCLHNFLMFEALEHTRANTGAVINGAIPVVVVVLDYLIFRRTIARASVLGVVVSFAGAVVVVTHGDVAALVTGDVGYGEFLFVIAISGWAAYTILARPLLERLPLVTVTAYACLAGGLLMVPPMLWRLEATLALLAEPLLVAALVVQGILTMGLGFMWYYEGVVRLGPMNASVYVNLVPVFGVVLAAVTLGEMPDAPLVAGGALIIGGLLAVNRAEARRAATLSRSVARSP